MNTTIDKLNKLEQTKTAIKQAIIDKGVAVADSDTFATYPDKITAIQSGSPLPAGDEKWITGYFPQNSVVVIPTPYNFTIRDFCFGSIQNITKITQDDKHSFCSFGESSFRDCWELEEVDLEYKVSSTYNSFRNCHHLKKVTLSRIFHPDNKENITCQDSCFRDCWELEEVNCEYITKCGDSTFLDCYSLNPSKLPFLKNLKEAGYYSFALEYKTGKDVNFTSIDLPAIETIGYRAFSGRRYLTTVNIGNKITTINSSCFQDCPALTKITINKPQDSVAGAPWGATNATVVWNG